MRALEDTSIMQRGLTLAALCFVLGGINGILAFFGGIVGDALPPSPSRSLTDPVVVLAIALPIVFWLWLCIPIIFQITKRVRRRSQLHDFMTGTWVAALCAGFLLSMLAGLGTVMLPNIYGILAGLACWPVLMLLARKHIGCSILCLALGGIFGYLLWAEIINIDALIPQSLLMRGGLYLSIALPALVVLVPIPFILFFAPNAPPLLASANTQLCPTCNYDLRGLPGGATCPECGAKKTPDPLDRVVTTEETVAQNL